MALNHHELVSFMQTEPAVVTPKDRRRNMAVLECLSLIWTGLGCEFAIIHTINHLQRFQVVRDRSVHIRAVLGQVEHGDR